jgi:hypothetical protein
MSNQWEEHGLESQPGSGQIDQAASEALAATEHLASVPLAEHVARFEAVHGALSDALSTIDKE